MLTLRVTDVAVWPRPSVTLNTSPEAGPTAVGVPVIAPVDVLRDTPAGSVPEVRAQVYEPLPPTATSEVVYVAPTLPPGRVVVVTPRVVAVADTAGDCQRSPTTATTEYV